MGSDQIRLDGSGSKRYMSFEKILRSAQGMAIWGDRAFILYDTGLCGIYDLKTRNPEPLAQFPLGSYNPGIPSNAYKNHANSCMFSRIHWGDNPIPLLYVSTGTGIGYDEDGFYYRCAVENIREDPGGTWRAETVQTISYHPEGQLPGNFESPAWGCPCILPDNDTGHLYIFSARYRTKSGCVPAGERNAYIVTKFHLPDPKAGGLIRLGPGEILDQFTVTSDVLFTQGGCILDSKLYFTFGYPQGGYPLHILVFDLERKCLAARVDDLTEAFEGEEIECCGLYRGKLLCNTCNGSIFEMEEGLLPLP